MAKTQKELKELKTEYETLNNKLKELTEEELSVVTGGNAKWAYIVGSALAFKESSASTMLKATQSIFEELPEE